MPAARRPAARPAHPARRTKPSAARAGRPEMAARGSSGAPELPDLWLLQPGKEQDVVVSTRMRLARNVAGFHFKTRFRQGEGERLESPPRGGLKRVEPALPPPPSPGHSAT